MMKFIITLFFLKINYFSFGQLPFEKFKAISVKEYEKWISIDKIETEGKLISYISVPDFFTSKESITIQLTCFDTLDYSKLAILKNGKQIQEIIEPDAYYGLRTPFPVFVADYNNDSLTDIKFLIPNFGCGGYNTYSRVIYLLQKSDGRFVKISFTDHFFEDDNNRIERDFDGDGNFEVITQTFQNYNKHNYWLYNIYSFKNFELVNANQKDDYPIMIQLLYRDNFEITKNLSRDKMKVFGRKLPSDYNKK